MRGAARRWLWLATSLAASSLSCGRVLFAPAPFTPTDVELAYSPDENLTRLRWNVKDATGLRFELRTATSDFTAVAFDKAPYPSGAYACGGGACYQLVLRGRVSPPSDSHMVRSHEPDLGYFVGPSITRLGDLTPALKITASLSNDNATLSVAVADWLAAPGLERKFRLTEWAEPSAQCAATSAAHPDAAAEIGGALQNLPFPPPMTVEGRYCVRAATEPADAGAQAFVAAPLLTTPDLVREERDYQPDYEIAPVVWRLVTDLQIVEETRCATVAQTVHDTFANSLAQAGAPSHELDAIDLAPKCQQSMARAIDVGPVADDVKTYLAAHYPNRYFAPLLLYVNNLELPLPESLVTSLQTYESSFTDPDVRPIDVAMASGAAAGSFMWAASLQFVAIEDKQFATSITNLINATLPFYSQLHLPDDVIPLRTEGAKQLALGTLWKVCQASPSIVRVDHGAYVPAATVVLAYDPNDPPGFTVTLPVKVLVPKIQFKRDTVIVRTEICHRWCNHPFTDEGGTRHPSWKTASACLKNSLP